MQHHIQNAKKFGVTTVVCINGFATDSVKEWEVVKQKAMEVGAQDAVICTHWSDGGAGATGLGEAVVRACELDRQSGGSFRYLYPLSMSIKEKMNRICCTYT